MVNERMYAQLDPWEKTRMQSSGKHMCIGVCTGVSVYMHARVRGGITLGGKKNLPIATRPGRSHGRCGCPRNSIYETQDRPVPLSKAGTGRGQSVRIIRKSYKLVHDGNKASYFKVDCKKPLTQL